MSRAMRLMERAGGRSAPAARRAWTWRGRRSDGSATLVRAVGQVAAALRVGASPSAAWGDLGVRCEDGVPRAEDLRALGGAALGGAARVGASRDGAAPVIAAIRAAARVAARAGAPPAVLLDGAGAALEAQAELADRRRAALAGPAASARLLGWLPGVGLLLGLAVGADPLAILLDGGMGTALLCAGVVAALSGRAWTRGLVRAAADAGCEGHAAHGEHDARRRRPDTSGAARSLGPTRSARVRALARPAGSVAAAEVPAGVVLELVAASCAAGASVPGAAGAGGQCGGRREGLGPRRGGGAAAARGRLVGGVGDCPGVGSAVGRRPAARLGDGCAAGGPAAVGGSGGAARPGGGRHAGGGAPGCAAAAAARAVPPPGLRAGGPGAGAGVTGPQRCGAGPDVHSPAR